jgi:error-prone DNA polymerase
VAAGFTPGEADQLRRAMAAWRRPGVIDQFRVKLLQGMRQNGLSEEFAQRVYQQIQGFGEYGFPESHAASFALLVYASAWLKHHYPAAFAAALINSQPLGFYAPAQLVRDAREHGVEVRGVDVNLSRWDCTLEHGAGSTEQGVKREARAGARAPTRSVGRPPMVWDCRWPYAIISA